LDFDGSAAPLNMVDQPLKAGIIMKPPVAGAWKWSGDNQLIFTPEKHWPIGRKFEVTLDKKAIAEHVRLDTYELEFETVDFVAEMSEAEFYQDPVDPKIKKVVATVHFNYPVDPESFEKRVELTLADPANKGKKTHPRFVVS